MSGPIEDALLKYQLASVQWENRHRRLVRELNVVEAELAVAEVALKATEVDLERVANRIAESHVREAELVLKLKATGMTDEEIAAIGAVVIL
jgi:DNA-directed RNA polymerase specialized sigma24 family protein